MSIVTDSFQMRVNGNGFETLSVFEKDGVRGTLNFFTEMSERNPEDTDVYLSWNFECDEEKRFDGDFNFSYLKREGYTHKTFPKRLVSDGVSLDFRIGTTDEVQKNQREEYAFKYHLVLTPKTDDSEDVVELEKRFTPSELNDTVLVIKQKKLHVNKMFLSYHSEFFHKMFTSEFKEKSLTEIPIEDVEFEDFACFLLSIYPIPEPPTDDNSEKLLELADRFMMPAVVHQVEQHLLTDSDMRFCKLLILSDKYKMKKLEKKLMKRISSFEDAQRIYSVPDYHLFSDQLKATILDKLMSACDIS